MALVLAPDMELWLTRYLRAPVFALGADISNKEPADLQVPLARPLIVVRDDSGNRKSKITFDRSIGVSVLAGSRRHDQPANDLARRVMAILTDDAIVEAEGSPIASVDDCNGPYPVQDELDVARRYFTVQYTVVGSW
ncbi:hypothetical protein [Leucobacter tenebrionis]|uniref:hypothetical protein n=1 Tax=Leucobacter tenebrionis TaxID=2873270 RepID=UPI001CA73E01|nr:hypothetical protein [Leucobacter tenebrionis]QZY52921.1 hypothetical protein KVY00_05665 [Leucobacter tenebrionis]